ncbi:unnamed protein product [Calicophoron daubneyi]|uniref:NADH:ubiquinone oxidoreductase intermediate-associated protein 30 domain-containing protein n=1 Tax=Calicophoron daubneyi TaxID=300641 RepID=A0AAV2TRB7_CALDB
MLNGLCRSCSNFSRSTCCRISAHTVRLSVAILTQQRCAYANSSRQSYNLPQSTEFGAGGDNLPSGIQIFIRWLRRLRPLKTEIADLRRRIRRNKGGFDLKVPALTRYFVRFPFLTDAEFADWSVTTDSALGLGYSWAEFVRSPRSASGLAGVENLPGFDGAGLEDELKSNEHSPVRIEDDTHPYAYIYPPTYPKRGPRPGGKQASSDALISSATDRKFKGYGWFRGFISTRVPDRGDLVRAGFANVRCPETTLFGFLMPYALFSYTHMIIRYRGDGRAYRINIATREDWDITFHDVHQFILYTRGGPYWQIAKIPFSRFIRLAEGKVRLDQIKLRKDKVRLISFTLMDDIDGPFSLELDYIALYVDQDHHEEFAYEQYDRSGIVQ